VFQSEYDAARKELRLRFDLGFSPTTGAGPPGEPSPPTLLRYDARDGFRGATEALPPPLRRGILRQAGNREVVWLAFNTPRAIEGWPGLPLPVRGGVHKLWVGGAAGADLRCGMWSPGSATTPSPRHALAGRPMAPWTRRAPSPGPRPWPPIARSPPPRMTAPATPPTWAVTSRTSGGNPQGYFFRSPQGPQREHDDSSTAQPGALPPPRGGAAVHGRPRQRGLARPPVSPPVGTCRGGFCIACRNAPAPRLTPSRGPSGRQSLRFDPSRSKG